MDNKTVLSLLRQAIKEAGTMSQFAKEQEVSLQYVSDVLHGKRAPGPKILRALGLRREVVYAREKL